MAQTAWKLINGGDDVLDFTFAADKTAGDAHVFGTCVLPVVRDVDYLSNPLGALYNDGVFDIPKKSESFTAGDAVYWDPSGTPVTGDASSGAATGTAAAHNNAGVCIKDAESGDDYVRVAIIGTNQVGT